MRRFDAEDVALVLLMAGIFAFLLGLAVAIVASVLVDVCP